MKQKILQSKEDDLATIHVESQFDCVLYIWNWLSWRCSTNNYKTMVSLSPRSSQSLSGVYNFTYTTMYSTGSARTERTAPYFMGFGINPNWTIFMKPIPYPARHLPPNGSTKSGQKRSQKTWNGASECSSPYLRLYGTVVTDGTWGKLSQQGKTM